MSPAVFNHGDLRLYLLSILADGPQHGYGLIQALSDRTGGTYVPSAGTIYPRLAQLEEEGLVTKHTDGRRSVYAITDAGRAELAEREEEIQPIEASLNDSVRLIAAQVRSSVAEAMAALKAEFAAAKASAAENPRTDDAEEPAFKKNFSKEWNTTKEWATGFGRDFSFSFGASSGETGKIADEPVSEPKPEQASNPGRANLARAEMAIANFAAQARAALRTRVARGGALEASDLDRLEAKLRELLDEV